jgi:hypothetical protein
MGSLVPDFDVPLIPPPHFTTAARGANLAKKSSVMMDVPFQMDASVLASVADAVNRINQTLGNGHNSATDSAFSMRLEKALEKNFNYIRK